jgi:hypothetical protein
VAADDGGQVPQGLSGREREIEEPASEVVEPSRLEAPDPAAFITISFHESERW